MQRCGGGQVAYARGRRCGDGGEGGEGGGRCGGIRGEGLWRFGLGLWRLGEERAGAAAHGGEPGAGVVGEERLGGRGVVGRAGEGEGGAVRTGVLGVDMRRSRIWGLLGR